jgi:hypothetical protein
VREVTITVLLSFSKDCRKFAKMQAYISSLMKCRPVEAVVEPIGHMNTGIYQVNNSKVLSNKYYIFLSISRFCYLL